MRHLGHAYNPCSCSGQNEFAMTFDASCNILRMQVRCACRRLKERRPCSVVRQQLKHRGLPAEIDSSSAVQLLSCDSKCHQLKVCM